MPGAAEEQHIGTHRNGGAQSPRLGKGFVQVIRAGRVQYMEPQLELRSRRFQGLHMVVGERGIGRVDQDGDSGQIGMSSCSNSIRLGATSTPSEAMPVRLPPGRLRLATSPAATGSPPIEKTIGIVLVAALTPTSPACWSARR